MAPTLTTDAVEPNRFVAAHGEKALVMGYPKQGLEIWAYPFQILSGYQVSFRQAGATAAIDGRLLLRRVDYSPDAIVRTYIGPDYLVRERLFVPLDRAAAVLSYEVEGIRAVDIDVRFLPVLNLMWPGAWGGQYTRWNVGPAGTDHIPGFVITEPAHGYSAAIGSRQIKTHDDTVNSAVRPEASFSFSLHPVPGRDGGPAKAAVFVALNEPNAIDPVAGLKDVAAHVSELEADSAAHYHDLGRNALRVETPDKAVNESLAWAVTALDQAWVCNPKLGCGLVAGYGPSRDARRPQYAWFFGGDGLVATNALVSAGEYGRAREELEFIQKYQDAKTGQIWHELSQSAGFIDWSKYPYMYVHVDISFDYLATLARYVHVSGDVAFASAHWASIQAAYGYCRQAIAAGDHLPHIPADKEGSDEQHRPADDLGLSASWMAAADGFAELAELTAHKDESGAARHEAQAARRSIPEHYWNAARNFWFDGHTQAGEPIFRDAVGPTQLLAQNVFSPEQKIAVLDQLAAADFETDWGIRGVAASAPAYNPYSYNAGSVSALGTTAVATSFWQAHRPATAEALWHGVVAWNTLDSLGHIHELLAGNYYQEETESVPEQTWSSAGFVDATARGLLGIAVDGVANSIRMTPHLPANWPMISVENIRLPHSVLAVKISQSIDGLDMDIENTGASTSLEFEPQIPLGARVLNATYESRAITAQAETFPADQHAKLALQVMPGRSHCHISFEGGVALWTEHRTLHVGDRSSELKIVSVQLQGHLLALEADVFPDGGRTLRLRTPWKIAGTERATLRTLADHEYELTFAPVAGVTYGRAHCTITFSTQ